MRILTKMAVSLIAVGTLGLGSAQAALMNFTLTGDVSYADSNLFNLVGGDSVTVVGTFDDSVLSGGTGSVSFAGTGNTFVVTAGDATFTETDDVSGGVYPRLDLTAYAFEDFWFLFDVGTGGYFDSGLGYFDGDDGDFGIVTGTWVDFSMSPVPVPAAAWLLGSGLLGLVGIARRKAAA